jgi:PAS domain S-box-containing protein
MSEKIKVLLLDDTEDAVILQTFILEQNGFEVVSAANGIEGLEKLQSYRPDIIISDVLMPEMDGFAFCRKVKENEALKNIPLVFYSAQYTDRNDRKLAEDLGAEGFIIKPIEMDLFLSKINKILQDHISNNKKHITFAQEPKKFDEQHYIAQSKMLDKKLKELEEEHQKLLKSEENYRILLDGLSSDYFLFSQNVNGIYDYLSPSVTKLLGYSRDELRANFSTYLTKNSINSFIETYKKNALLGKEQVPYEIEIKAKNGSIYQLHITEKPLFDKENSVIGIEGIAHNITSQKALEKYEHESSAKMHKALVETIRAIAMTVEKRDPYTAGHQQRVAQLAVLIGKKLNMSKDALEGLFLGASVHDIGKITIPIDILSKPTKLLDIEFALIKNHPQQGYEILKDVEFPWPISKMILQHHERIDGSGYPNGLKGDEIILEAKIICVADVVEAISSHRPYRAALGIDIAINDIKKYRGILYDTDVVDAILEVVEETETLFE